MYFLDSVLPENVASEIGRGGLIGTGWRKDSAYAGRE